MHLSTSAIASIAFPALLLLSTSSASALDLQPGVYRQYTVNARQDNWWRVTDPGAKPERARAFLPNHTFTFEDVELSGVVRAEIVMHHWAGHAGTQGQQFIINGEHRVDIPVNPNVNGMPREGYMYLNDSNPVFEIPLDWLKDGGNTIQGTIAEDLQGHHWWGQWGWYWIGLRVWYGDAVPAVTAGVLAVAAEGKTIGGDGVELSFTPADGAQVDEVQFFARYHGFDEDGDNVFDDWHGFYNVGGEPEGHVGSDGEAPFTAHWDVSWVPDQKRGAVSFIAVLRSGQLYRVCEPLTGYTLRRDYSVKLFKATDYPFTLVRNHAAPTATIFIPEGSDISMASGARLVMRSWNGANNEEKSTRLRINEGEYLSGLITGADHYYALDMVEIDPAALKPGENILQFTSDTEHHGCEVLVPGPAILLRWNSER